MDCRCTEDQQDSHRADVRILQTLTGLHMLNLLLHYQILQFVEGRHESRCRNVLGCDNCDVWYPDFYISQTLQQSLSQW